MKIVRLVVACAGLVAAHPAWSQVSVYGEITAAQVNAASGQQYLYGPTIGISAPIASRFHVTLGGDLRGAFLFEGNTSFASLVVGPRLGTTVKKFSPYAEGMVGFGRYNDGNFTTVSASTDALVEGNLGVDYPVSKHVDWRIVEGGYEQFFELGNRIHPWTFSTGVVVHLGSR